jgi:alanine racemase
MGWHTGVMDGQPEATIDLATIRANAVALCRHVGAAEVMAVVKSDGYGHGMLPSATAAVAGGATWLGVLQLSDAIALRQAGLSQPIVSLHGAPDAPHGDAIRHDIDLTVGTVDLLTQVAAAAQQAGRPARLHLEVDTGMGRGGATQQQWSSLVRAAMAAEAAGQARIVGVWSHLACADLPGHPAIGRQIAAFRAAVEAAERVGARPQVRHLANGPAAVTLPETYFDLVRPGGSIFGLSTLPGGPPDWLRPAMTLRARLIQVKRVAAGTPVSYAHRYVADRPTTLGILPLGYHEGIPRHATNLAGIAWTRGRRVSIAGTVNLNHVILDLGDHPAEAGDEVVLFGPGDNGEATAQEWADRLGTVSYEIVTRFTGQVPRTYSGVAEAREKDDRRPAGRTGDQVAATH